MAERPTAIDLARCEREPIHIPGAIQPHGLLFVVSPAAPHRILQVSANVVELLGLELEQLLGADLLDLLELVASEFDGALADATRRRSHAIPLMLAGRRWNGVVHRSDGAVIVELEPVTKQALGDSLAEQAVLRELIAEMLAAESAAALHELLPAPLRRLTGYDRVMVYLFGEGGDGTVVTEDREPTLEPYRGLRYPASDIPSQARRLYVAEPVRVIADAHYEPVPILPTLRPDTGAALDLSHAILRSVSPVHCAYLRNMGVRASMSLSLIDDDRLIGLIACHHRRPHLPCYELRSACVSIARIAAFVHVARTRERTDAALRRAARTIDRLIDQTRPNADITGGLVGPDASVLDLLGADGAIIHHRDRSATLGATPPREFVDGLVAWLQPRTAEGSYVSSSLAAEYPPAAEQLDTAAGVLAISLGGDDGLIAWLRTEVVRTVEWAGDPNEAVERDASGRLSPRRSFALWREQVRGRALPFEAWEREAAECLRRQLADVVLERATELDRLNHELRAALQVRDDFLSIASHELKTPLSTLLLAIESLALTMSEAIASDPRFKRRLEVARRQVVRLDHLVTGLLDVTRIQAGKLELELDDADLAATVHEVVERMAVIGPAIEVVAPAQLPCRFDRLRIDQVVTNLLSNALKYAGEGPIEVEVAQLDERARVRVCDRGPGIPAELRANLFERFVRARDAPAASGFGLGLWIAKAIVLAHGGEIRAEDTPGGGTTMVVELPCPTPEQAP